jgi:hypothetical protein
MTDRPTFTTTTARHCLGYQAVGTAVFELWDEPESAEGGDVIKVAQMEIGAATPAEMRRAHKMATDLAATLNARML